MRVTIKDIARKCNISPATVSLVLNNKETRISEETKRKVRETVKELNYRPNKIAVSLITKKTASIGLIIPDICNLFFAEIAKGAEEKAAKLNYNIILCNTNDKPENDIKYTNILLDRGVDGIIIAMSSSTLKEKMPRCIKNIIDAKKPYIIVDRIPKNSSETTISIDNQMGGYLATKYLIECGHNKIACITGPIVTESARLRFKGYLEALKEFNIKHSRDGVFEGNYHVDSGYELAESIIDNGYSAVFSCNDMMAYGIYKRIRKMGLNVPGDLSIVGFDDIFFSEIMEIPLTTISQPVYEMGSKAAEKIIDKIENDNEINEQIIFKPELVIRDSVKAIKRGSC